MPAARRRNAKTSSRPKKNRQRALLAAFFVLCLVLIAGGVVYAFQTPARQSKLRQLIEKQLTDRKRFDSARIARQLWLIFHRDAIPYDDPSERRPGPDLAHLYGGIPASASASKITVIHNLGYSVGYDEDRKNPAWVAYRLFAVPVDTRVEDRPSQFNVDLRTAAQVRSEDYTGSGFDRGHMAPNFGIARCYGPIAQIQTFLMSNIAPQRHALNAGPWKNIEMLEATDYAQHCEEIWVICGSVFNGKIIREIPSGVPIPDAFYKIIIDEQHGALRVLAFLFSQNSSGKTKPEEALCSVDTIETNTGMDFFPELPEAIQKQLESTVPNGLW